MNKMILLGLNDHKLHKNINYDPYDTEEKYIKWFGGLLKDERTYYKKDFDLLVFNDVGYYLGAYDNIIYVRCDLKDKSWGEEIINEILKYNTLLSRQNKLNKLG
jgi:hypothetical protein